MGLGIFEAALHKDLTHLLTFAVLIPFATICFKILNYDKRTFMWFPMWMRRGARMSFGLNVAMMLLTTALMLVHGFGLVHVIDRIDDLTALPHKFYAIAWGTGGAFISLIAFYGAHYYFSHVYSEVPETKASKLNRHEGKPTAARTAENWAMVVAVVKALALACATAGFLTAAILAMRVSVGWGISMLIGPLLCLVHWGSILIGIFGLYQPHSEIRKVASR